MEQKINKYFNKEQLRQRTERVLEKVNHIARESHKKHVTIKDRHDRHLITFPMTLGIAAVVILPIVAGIGLTAFLMNDWMINVKEHTPEKE